MKSLIRQGLDPNTSIVHGLTPLMIASSCGHIGMVNTLLHHGANVNMVCDIRGRTALDCAKVNSIASLLILNGAVHGNITGGKELPIRKSPTHSIPASKYERHPFSFFDLCNTLFVQRQMQLPMHNIIQQPIIV